jgi:hypothetical protein
VRKLAQEDRQRRLNFVGYKKIVYVGKTSKRLVGNPSTRIMCRRQHVRFDSQRALVDLDVNTFFLGNELNLSRHCQHRSADWIAVRGPIENSESGYEFPTFWIALKDLTRLPEP